jgi:hypothetical protein
MKFQPVDITGDYESAFSERGWRASSLHFRSFSLARDFGKGTVPIYIFQ